MRVHVVEVRLDFRPPLWPDSLFGHLAATAVPGVEEWRDGWYRRTLWLPRGHGCVALAPQPDHISCRLLLTHRGDGDAAVAVCRRLLDLDADPKAIDGCLAADPTLRPLVAAVPGRRVPGAVDGPEMAVRAVLGQQVSTAAARTHAGRLVLRHGTPIDDGEGGLTHLFPTVGALRLLDPDDLALPRQRRHTLVTLVEALASGRVDLGANAVADTARAQLLTLPGIGPWTADTVAMRALGDRDAFVESDLGVRAAAGRLGLPEAPAALRSHAERWRPWRAYAVQHLWGTGGHAVNMLPVSGPTSAAVASR